MNKSHLIKSFIISCVCMFAAPCAWSQQPAKLRMFPDEFTVTQNKQSAEEQAEIDVAAALDAEAEVKFKKAETVFTKAMKITLYDPKQPAKNSDQYYQKQLTKKSQAIQEALPLFNDVISNGRSAKWGIASITRIGMLYQDVADQIVQAPVPPGIPSDVETAYKAQLIDFALQFYKKSIEYFNAAAGKCESYKDYREYAKELRQHVNQIQNYIDVSSPDKQDQASSDNN